MTLSEEQKKINKAISNKKYREQNKEKKSESDRIYRETHKEELKIKHKLYVEENRDHINEMARINQAKIRATDEGKKKYILANWLRIGLKGNYENIYKYYLKTTNCQECECVFGKRGDGTGTFKCMDHHHATGLFRNVLCNACNVRRK